MLTYLYNKFYKETELLLRYMLSSSPHGYDRFTKEMCVIRLSDAWARYCRNIVVLSSYAQPYTLTGIRIPRVQNLRTYSEFMQAFPNYGPRWNGWGNPIKTIQAARNIGISNFQQISMGIALTPSPLDSLRDIRNFFAHRNIKTAQAVRVIAASVNAPINIRPVDILLFPSSPGGASVFELWVHQLRNMARICAE